MNFQFTNFQLKIESLGHRLKIAKLKIENLQRGYAALAMTLVVLAASLTVVGGLTFFSLQEVAVNRAFLKSVDSRVIAESGVEDALWRVVSGKQIGASETLGVGKGATTITVVTAGNTRTIRSAASRENYLQNIESAVEMTTIGTSFVYGALVGEGGIEMQNNSTVNGSIYSNGDIIGATGATVTGDALAAGSAQIKNVAVGGNAQANLIDDSTVGGYASSTTKLDDVTVGKDAHANELDDTTVTKDAYYNIIDSSSLVLGSRVTPTTPPSNLSAVAFPIADATVDQWKSDAAAGGICALPQCDTSGNFKLSNGELGTLGPKKITGKLELDNGAALTISGTLWVVGDIILSNNCSIRLSPGYGSSSGVIITEGKLTISNNCTFQGSGSPGSYILVLSAKNAPGEEIMTVDNNSAGVIYYAAGGWIKFSNNAIAKQATARGIRLDNNASLVYELGLADVKFSAGPSGGYAVKYWKEVE